MPKTGWMIGAAVAALAAYRFATDWWSNRRDRHVWHN